MTAAVATVKGGFWPQYGVSYTTLQGRSSARRKVAQALGQRGLMAMREIAETLNGVVAGSAASKTLGRITANIEQGGKRAIETNTIISRNTTAADVTELNNYFFALSSKTTMASPANKDGNPLGTR